MGGGPGYVLERVLIKSEGVGCFTDYYILAVVVPIIWGPPWGSEGWRRSVSYCCVCSCICCYAQGFIASIATYSSCNAN